MTEVLIALAFLIVATLIGRWLTPPDVIDELSAAMRALTIEFEKLTTAARDSGIEFIELGKTWQRVREEHPDWFDPETGYLIELDR